MMPPAAHPLPKPPLDRQTGDQIGQCLGLLGEVFGPDLLGIYLYGSALVGGLQKFSDIDLLAVVDRPSTAPEKATIASRMLGISGVYLKSAKKPVELTIIVRADINPWRYPPSFDFQYGDWLRGEFERGICQPWISKFMPDLALLITQVLLASKTIYGSAPTELLCPVPYRDVVTALTDALDSLLAGLEPDTRNVLLTLARIWCTLETDAIWSKHAAAAWVIERLPPDDRPVMQRARAVYLGEENEGWDDLRASLIPCADFLAGQIRRLTAVRLAGGAEQRSIRLGEEPQGG